MLVQDWLGADNELGISIWERKYRNGNESFDEWLDRVSGGSPTVKRLILEKKFLFGGRILANRGLASEGKKITYSNCYVLSAPEDNLESIFETAKKLARTYSYGGGVGLDLSKLAPNGAKVRNAAKESSGAVSFMDLYSLVTGLISQNGRRGALMLSLDVNHPDIEEFIDIKKDLDRVTKANISVKVTDEFMRAVINDDDFNLEFTRKETGEVIKKTVRAKDLFYKIIESNWDMGEPGMLFWDRIESWNFMSEFSNFCYAGVNPCAEEPLSAGSSCLLGSINLSEFVDHNGNINFDELGNVAYDSTVALNAVLDEGMPLHPLEEQRESVRDWRSIGLGVFGFADMLIKMGVKYGSEESIILAKHIAQHILNYSALASCSLAVANGVFPKYDKESIIKSKFFNDNIEKQIRDSIEIYGMRNNQLLTIPPTGTLSTMLGVSGGLEPIFANYYERKTESLYGKDKYFKVYTPIVKEFMQSHNLSDDSNLPDYFVTASDINPIDRVKMQAAWQEYVDASISSTVNLPEEATVDDIAEIYLNAYKYGLKGITVFRSGCRRAGVLTAKPKADTNSETEPQLKESSDNTLPRGFILDASDNLIGKKRKLQTGCGSLHCTAFFDPDTGDLMETYLSRGSTGGCANSYTGLSRMISLSARAGVDINTIVDQLNSSGVCPSYYARRITKHDTSPGSSCPVAIGKALKDMWQEMQDEIADDIVFGEDKPKYKVENVSSVVLKDKDTNKVVLDLSIEKCPECGEPLQHEGGCDVCKNCGYSHCG